MNTPLENLELAYDRLIVDLIQIRNMLRTYNIEVSRHVRP
jgi:hypothetical protein